MKKKIIAGLLTIILVGSSSANVFAMDNKTLDSNYSNKVSAKQMLKGKKYAKDELIVVFSKNYTTATINSIVNSEDASIDKTMTIADKKAAKVEISSEDTLTEAIVKFQDNPRVELVQPNYKYSIIESAKITETGLTEATDVEQYHFAITKAKDAWTYIESKTYDTTKVAVIDTGVDPYHSDLQANLSSTTGYTRTVGGFQTIEDNDSDEHGTHVSGIIGATTGNGGATGVASGNNNDLVEVLVVGASEDGLNLFTSDVIAAINYASAQGAKAMNMSFGGEGRDRAMEIAIKNAYDDGIVFVASSGNEETDAYTSPSDFKEVISVNASNEYNKPAYWSNYGINKDITAPGNNIVSTLPGNYLGAMSGTSMASPIITGIVALMLDINPDLTPAEVYNILCASTASSTFDNYLAYGIVDARAAVEAANTASDSVEVSELTIKNDFIQLGENDTFGLESLIRPATSLKDITWSSSNYNVVSVNSNTGELKGISKGLATITATADGKTATCDVRVVKTVEPESITITNKEKFASIAKGTTGVLKATIAPTNATNKEVYWVSNNPSIVDINEYGELKANNIGETIITARSYDGTKIDGFTINVTKNAEEIEFTSSVSKILMGETFTYQARSLDEDGLPLTENNGIVWGSINETIAAINSETGVVTPIKPGVTYIEAIDENTQNSDYPIVKTKALIVGKANYSGKDYGLKVKAKDYNSVTISWTKIPVAQSYVIERKIANGTYKVIKTQTATTFKDTGLSLNKTYYYRIKANYNSSKSFGYSLQVSAKTALKTPTLKVYNTTGYALKLNWSKINGANGYDIYRYNRYTSKYQLIKTIKSGSTTSYTDLDLKVNKRYYYKIKAYRIVNGKKIYSSYSNTSSVVVW